MYQIVENTSLPEWPTVPPVGSDPKSEVVRQYNLAVAKLQSTSCYQHCQGSENLSYRRAVNEMLEPWLEQLSRVQSVSEDRTIPYVEGVCPRTLPATMKMGEPRFEPWDPNSGGSGRSRYVYLSLVPA